MGWCVMELWNVGELRMGMHHNNFWQLGGGTDIFVGVPAVVFLGGMSPAVWIRRETAMERIVHC